MDRSPEYKVWELVSASTLLVRQDRAENPNAVDQRYKFHTINTIMAVKTTGTSWGTARPYNVRWDMDYWGPVKGWEECSEEEAYMILFQMD